jgi:hypothetical protein
MVDFSMSTFVAVDDRLLIDRIDAVSSRIVFVAPAVSKEVATALGGCLRRADQISITLVLDPDAEAHRIGYGDREGLEKLRDLASDNHIGLLLSLACASAYSWPTTRS